MLKAKEVEGATSSQAPTYCQPMNTPVAQSPTSPVPLEHTKYGAICTQLGKVCPNEFPMSSDCNEDDEEELKDQNKGKDQNSSEGKTPQTRFSSVTTFTPQPPNPPSNS